MRNRDGKFRTPYTKKVIVSYLKSVEKLIGKSPTFRDLKSIPGPSPRTVIRHFGTWTNAIKAAGIRPQTNQLMKGERGYIRKNWRTKTDVEIAKVLGVTPDVIKYYRIQFKFWKNRKGTSSQKHKSDGMKLYGKRCEVCGIGITELHHIVRKSTAIEDWSILCPTCHAVITRKLVSINCREELFSKLRPYIMELHKMIDFKLNDLES